MIRHDARGTMCDVAGAMHVDLAASLDLSAAAVIFLGNEATEGDGGAIHGGSVKGMTITNSTFVNNRAMGRGGGITLLMYQDALIDGCVFYDNTCLNGGALWIGTGFGDINIVHSTFRGNFAGERFLLACREQRFGTFGRYVQGGYHYI